MRSAVGHTVTMHTIQQQQQYVRLVHLWKKKTQKHLHVKNPSLPAELLLIF